MAAVYKPPYGLYDSHISQAVRKISNLSVSKRPHRNIAFEKSTIQTWTDSSVFKTPIRRRRNEIEKRSADHGILPIYDRYQLIFSKQNISIMQVTMDNTIGQFGQYVVGKFPTRFICVKYLMRGLVFQSSNLRQTIYVDLWAEPTVSLWH